MAIGHTIPRLELCTAVLAVQMSEIILEELNLNVGITRFYTDSQVVLDYIHSQNKRFYKNVENRIERIRKSATSYQWQYVPTNINPADFATRTVSAGTIHNSIWIHGPPQLYEPNTGEVTVEYPLINYDKDSEIRRNTNLQTMKFGINKNCDMFKFGHRVNILHTEHIGQID